MRGQRKAREQQKTKGRWRQDIYALISLPCSRKEHRRGRKDTAPGQLVQMEGVNIHPGGAVANTGLAMKHLGVDVRLMGKIGKDELGTLILNCLEKYGAAEGMILADQEKTSYSVVLAIPGIDRIFLHDPGANVNFSGSDLDFEAIKEADLFHFGYPP